MVKQVKEQKINKKKEEEHVSEDQQNEEENEEGGDEHFFGFDQIEEQDPKHEHDKQIIYNKSQMEQKVKEVRAEFRKKLKIQDKQKIPFSEHMSLVGDEKVIVEQIDLNDDTQREVQFYSIALENVKLALKFLEKEGVPLQRPGDYLVQMYKSDQIMKKIKGRLIEQDLRIKHQEERELRIQSKKLQKKIKSKKEQEKSKEKRQNLQAINDWKKEIKDKGEKARDLSEIMLDKKKFQGSKPGNQRSGSQGQKPAEQKASDKFKDKKQQILAKYGGRNKSRQEGGDRPYQGSGKKFAGATKRISKPNQRKGGQQNSKGKSKGNKKGIKKPNMKKRGAPVKKRR